MTAVRFALQVSTPRSLKRVKSKEINMLKHHFSLILKCSLGALLLMPTAIGVADVTKSNDINVTPKIAWYGKLTDGLAEAKRSRRPILLVSAAPQCQNVSGMW